MSSILCYYYYLFSSFFISSICCCCSCRVHVSVLFVSFCFMSSNVSLASLVSGSVGSITCGFYHLWVLSSVGSIASLSRLRGFYEPWVLSSVGSIIRGFYRLAVSSRLAAAAPRLAASPLTSPRLARLASPCRRGPPPLASQPRRLLASPRRLLASPRHASRLILLFGDSVLG